MSGIRMNSCKYLRICKDGPCGRPCSGEYCSYHKYQLKKHNHSSVPSCTNCNLRGTRSVTGICSKCIRFNYPRPTQRAHKKKDNKLVIES